jgi:hypothetical protein
MPGTSWRAMAAFDAARASRMAAASSGGAV